MGLWVFVSGVVVTLGVRWWPCRRMLAVSFARGAGFVQARVFFVCGSLRCMCRRCSYSTAWHSIA